MATSSSATASGRDQVPSNNPHLKAKMCVFLVTRNDGTPFDSTSMLEEDILQICVALGHTHPLGVLWYSATESVALFCMTEEMQQGGSTLHCLQAELGDLTDQELQQLMEDLHQEITLCELHAPPSNPQPTPWGEPSGSGNTNGDDQEVTFPRGGGWVPPKTTFPISNPSTTRWKVGSSGTASSTPKACCSKSKHGAPN